MIDAEKQVFFVLSTINEKVNNIRVSLRQQLAFSKESTVNDVDQQQRDKRSR